jgi:single-stranded DNA-binding protein
VDINRIQLTGRLDREPLLYDVGDHHVAALHLVCERRWRTSSDVGERAHEYYRLTAWEDLADACGRLLHAGDRIAVVGRLRLFTSWLNGVEHTAHEIVLSQMKLLTTASPRPTSSRRRTAIRNRRR